MQKTIKSFDENEIGKKISVFDAATERNQSADVLRVCAIVCVIGLHTAVYSGPNAVGTRMDVATVLINMSRFAVPLFFILSGYFWSMRCSTAADFLQRAVVSSKRIFFLFIVWSGVYIVAQTPEALHSYGVLGSAKLLYWNFASPHRFLITVFEGSKVHLWFLPALITSLIISGMLISSGHIIWLRFLAITLFIIGLAGSAYANSPFGFHAAFNFRNGPFFGLIFFVSGHFLAQIRPRSWWFKLGVGLAFSGLLLQLFEVQWINNRWGASLVPDYVFSTYPLGLGMALIALSNIPALRLPKLASIGKLVLGIYAMHYLFVDLFRPVDDFYHGSVIWEISYIVAVFLLSTCLAYIMSSSKYTSKFVA